MAFLIQQTATFSEWLAHLRDTKGKVAIVRRLTRAKGGNLGDAKSVGGGVSEMRLAIGPGYRLYFTRRGEVVIVLLCAGEKSTQPRDIELAKKLAGEIP